MLGEFKNGGSDYSPQGRPIEVNTHDFEDKELGKVVPYGIYDIGANDGYVSLGIDHDTGQFAVNSVRLCLDRIGRARYPATKRLMITVDVSINDSSFFDKKSLRARTSRTVSRYLPCANPSGVGICLSWYRNITAMVRRPKGTPAFHKRESAVIPVRDRRKSFAKARRKISKRTKRWYQAPFAVEGAISAGRRRRQLLNDGIDWASRKQGQATRGAPSSNRGLSS